MVEPGPVTQRVERGLDSRTLPTGLVNWLRKNRLLKEVTIMAGCCDPSSPKHTLLNVGGSIIGVLGLEEIIRDVYKLGVSDREKVRLELMSRFRKRNYLPGGAEVEYENAILQEYLKHISK